jgi:hypothetical protein
MSMTTTDALDHIGATEAPDGTGYVYRADETSEWYRITEEDAVALRDLMNDEDEDVARDAYSHWCAGYGELIGDDSAAAALGIT